MSLAQTIEPLRPLGRAPPRRPRRKPSLIGLSRAGARRSACAKPACPRRRCACASSQIWHWLYLRGVTDFSAMTNMSKGAARRSRRPLHAGAARDRHRAGLRGRHAQVAPALSAARRRAAGRDRDGLHPRGGARHALRLQPGRLHADLHLLPYRHAEAGAQPDGGGDRRRRSSSRASGSAIFPTRRRRRAPSCRAEGRLVSNVVMMGMGEPLYNFDNVQATRC